LSKSRSGKRRQKGEDTPDATEGTPAETEHKPVAPSAEQRVQQSAPANPPQAATKRKYTLSPEYQELVDLLDKAVPTWRPQPKKSGQETGARTTVQADSQPASGRVMPPAANAAEPQVDAGSRPPLPAEPPPLPTEHPTVEAQHAPVQTNLQAESGLTPAATNAGTQEAHTAEEGLRLPVMRERSPVQKRKPPAEPKPLPIITDDYKALISLLGKKSDGDELKRLADKLSARVTRHRAGKHETGIAFQGAGLWWVTDAGIISAVFIELRDPEKGFDSFTGSLGFGTTQQQCHAAMEKIDAQFIDSGKAPQHSGASKLHIWERYIHGDTILRFNFDQESGKLHNVSILRLEAAPVRPSGRATCEQIVQNHLSPAAQGVLARAKQEARRLDHDEIGTEQLLTALLATERGATHDLFHRFNLTADHVRAEVDKILPRGQGKTEYWLSPRLRAVIMVAWDEACRRESTKVHTTHLLLALLRFRNGFAIRILEALGVDIDHMRNALFDSLEASQDGQ